jgi:hypothetical protein
VRRGGIFCSREQDWRGWVALWRSAEGRGLPWITFDLGTTNGAVPFHRPEVSLGNSSSLGAAQPNAPSRSAMKPSTETLIE